MKRLDLLTTVGILALALSGSLAAPGRAHATQVGNARKIGIGFAVGDPTSIVGKYFIGGGNAIDLGLAFWSYGSRGYCRDKYRDRFYDCDDGGFSLAADYLWQETIARGTAQLDWHIGAGGRVTFAEYYRNNLSLAARMAVGLDLTFERPNFVEVFVELAPALLIVPGVHFYPEAFIGVRFYF